MGGLRWRLFDFGRINAQIHQAQAQEAESLAAYRQSVLRATEEVENALVSLDKRQELMAVLARVRMRSRGPGRPQAPPTTRAWSA